MNTFLDLVVIYLILGFIFRLTRTILPWGWYAWAQIFNVLSDILGLLVIWYPIMRQAWHDTTSTLQPGRKIDAWNNPVIQFWQGNWEDGSSGAYAKIWSGGQQVPYKPAAGPRWRAFCWWCRNRSWPVKVWFAWESGPLKKGTWILGREYKLGWARQISGNVLVCSL